MKTIFEAIFSVAYEKEIADTLWGSILRRFPKWNEDGADKAERPLVIPTGEPRWISEEEDAASPPSPRLRGEEGSWVKASREAAENINRNHRA